MTGRYIIGDALTVLRTLPDESVHCCATSPPYWGLRNYGVAGQLGLEPTPEQYVARMVEVFREVRRVLRADGTLWLNIGDSYAANRPYQVESTKGGPKHGTGQACGGKGAQVPDGLKPKDLVGIPWRLAFALQADGWWLRADIIWCLSGGTLVYARTQKGDMPMTIKDLSRLRPETVQLWNGERWTRLLGVSRSPRQGDEVELVLRSGERISCTPTHWFPTARGRLTAAEIRVGDTLQTTTLPDAEKARDCAIDADAAWFAGLYIAEGSMSGGTIQLAGHAKEAERWSRVQRIATKYGGSATVTTCGNMQAIRVYGKVLRALIDELVTGRTARDKGFAPVVWRYSNDFIAAMVEGYLSGDGHHDAQNDRWRLGFTRNYNLARDLRTACARLGYRLVLNLSSVRYDGRDVPTFRGELRKTRRGHRNEKKPSEVVAINKARCRHVYDLGVADEPHIFALASGVLTHNSKPNPMPESVTDRPTKAHEYVFLLAKSERYYYDHRAIREADGGKPAGNVDGFHGRQGGAAFQAKSGGIGSDGWEPGTGRNARSVWTIATEPYSGAHFATMPSALVSRCILAGCPAGGVVLDPFLGSGTVGMVAESLGRRWLGIELQPLYEPLIRERTAQMGLVAP